MSTGERSSNLIDMKVDASDKKVRSFGILFSALALGVAVFSYLKNGHAWPWFTGASALFLITGLFLQPVLRPLYILWMRFAAILAWFNTRLILGVFFYGILTPVGAILRIQGKDPLKRSLDRTASTYWIKRRPETFNPKRYERLF
jgi:hypothetical protein